MPIPRSVRSPPASSRRTTGPPADRLAGLLERGGLSAPNRVKQMHAARAVGTLRDRRAVPALVDLLASRDRFVQETALEALCSITGQQHGLKPHRWRAWWEAHGHEHRLEWIMESLRHRDVLVRRWANDELTRLTGHRVSARPQGDKREQEACYQQWRAWWEEVGRARHAPADPAAALGRTFGGT